MAHRIEDYALIGNLRTAALVGKDGSIDWLCAPRFDSPACFAAILGDAANGHWRISPPGNSRRITRRYRGDTLVLETEFETEEGTARIVDCMPPLAGSEGAFLICSFWLVSALALMGRLDEARQNLKQLAALRNDVGLLSEEYDPSTNRLLGNFPQAFSHIGLLHSLFTLVDASKGH